MKHFDAIWPVTSQIWTFSQILGSEKLFFKIQADLVSIFKKIGEKMITLEGIISTSTVVGSHFENCCYGRMLKIQGFF